MTYSADVSQTKRASPFRFSSYILYFSDFNLPGESWHKCCSANIEKPLIACRLQQSTVVFYTNTSNEGIALSILSLITSIFT